eukprot:842688-Amphidinium_carterae.1
MQKAENVLEHLHCLAFYDPGFGRKPACSQIFAGGQVANRAAKTLLEISSFPEARSVIHEHLRREVCSKALDA